MCVRPASWPRSPSPAATHAANWPASGAWTWKATRARACDPELVQWADNHILCLTESHLRSLTSSFPEAKARPEPWDTISAIRSRRSMAVYQRCAEQIEEALRAL